MITLRIFGKVREKSWPSAALLSRLGLRELFFVLKMQSTIKSHFGRNRRKCVTRSACYPSECIPECFRKCWEKFINSRENYFEGYKSYKVTHRVIKLFLKKKLCFFLDTDILTVIYVYVHAEKEGKKKIDCENYR